MMFRLSFLIVSTLFLFGCQPRNPSSAERPSVWEQSIVTLKVDRNRPDYFQPWSSELENIQKSAVVVEDHRLLTTADGLRNSTLIRVQREGSGPWWNVDIVWIDDHADLALLKVDDPAFWKGLRSAHLAQTVPRKGRVQLRRWQNGNLEDWSADITKLVLDWSRTGILKLLKFDITTKMPAGGWSEIVTRGADLLGLTDMQNDSVLRAIPAPMIRLAMNAHPLKSGIASREMGRIDFAWQPAENPHTLRFLGLTHTPYGGVIVNNLPIESRKSRVLKPRDIILEIDGQAVDMHGSILDSEYGSLPFEYLAVRNKYAGDILSMKVWRDGHILSLSYVLPSPTETSGLVTRAMGDHPPEYLIAGGLVFQPLTLSYLESWGQDWGTLAPFRLTYYTREFPTPNLPSILILSQVLPDTYNLGYQDIRTLAVKSVNGRPVHKLIELIEALRHPIKGYHSIEFLNDKQVGRILLEASEMDAATQRVLERYDIRQDHVLAEK